MFFSSFYEMSFQDFPESTLFFLVVWMGLVNFEHDHLDHWEFCGRHFLEYFVAA